MSLSRPCSPWERGTHREHRRAESVNTSDPQSIRITTHQPYHRRHRRRAWVDAPEQPWGGPTSREAYERLLVASTTRHQGYAHSLKLISRAACWPANPLVRARLKMAVNKHHYLRSGKPPPSPPSGQSVSLGKLKHPYE